MREVFEELGLQGDVLEESCKVVGSSDETLLEFMKVQLLLFFLTVHFLSMILTFLVFIFRLSSLVATTKTWSAAP